MRSATAEREAHANCQLRAYNGRRLRFARIQGEGNPMKVEDIKNVTVVGGGTQRSQIASQIAYKGFAVTVWVRSEASVERARFATIVSSSYSQPAAMPSFLSKSVGGVAPRSRSSLRR